jgi:hypothetical protein
MLLSAQPARAQPLVHMSFCPLRAVRWCMLHGAWRVFRCSVRANLLVLADIAMVQCERVVEFGLFVAGAGPSPVGCDSSAALSVGNTTRSQRIAHLMQKKPAACDQSPAVANPSKAAVRR